MYDGFFAARLTLHKAAPIKLTAAIPFAHDNACVIATPTAHDFAHIRLFIVSISYTGSSLRTEDTQRCLAVTVIWRILYMNKLLFCGGFTEWVPHEHKGTLFTFDFNTLYVHFMKFFSYGTKPSQSLPTSAYITRFGRPNTLAFHHCASVHNLGGMRDKENKA